MFKCILALTLVVALTLNAVDAKVDENVSLMDLINPKSANFVACTACETVVAQLKAMVDDPTKANTIHQQLGKLCDACPDSKGRHKCHENLDKNFAKMVDYLRHADPYDVCSKMHVCPARVEMIDLTNN